MWWEDKRRWGSQGKLCPSSAICNGYDKNTLHPISNQLPTSSQLLPSLYPFIFFPQTPSDPIKAKGSSGDSSCMAEEKVIKRRRPKEEVKGPGELLPPKRTHWVLGTGNFSQGGSIMECFPQGWTCSSFCVFFISPSQTNDDSSHLAVIILHKSI